MKYSTLQSFLDYVAQRNPGQPEFLQAVTEVMESLWPFITQHPRYAQHALLERLVEPERVIMFRVSWVDDHGEVQVNRGYRIQHSSAIGPYKGGLPFPPLGESLHPQVSRLRADVQERSHDAAHGRRQGRFRLRPQGQEPG